MRAFFREKIKLLFIDPSLMVLWMYKDIISVASKVIPFLRSKHHRLLRRFHERMNRTLLFQGEGGGVRLYCRMIDRLETIPEIFERHIYDFFALPKNAVIIDVGAGIGEYTVKVGHAYPDAKIIALEPHLEAFEIFKRNIELNNLLNIKALNRAVSDTESKVTIFHAEFSHSDFMAGTKDSLSEKGRKFYTIPATTLDALIEELQLTNIDMIKIDVEGAEAHVLRGAQRLIRRWCPKVIIEVHSPQLEKEVLHLLPEYQIRKEIWIDKNKKIKILYLSSV